MNDPGDIVIEVSPAVASLIFKGKLAYVGDEILDSGCIGSVAGCRVYVSNNIVVAADSNKKNFHKCCLLYTSSCRTLRGFAAVSA